MQIIVRFVRAKDVLRAKAFLRSKEGATAIEYGLIAALIALAAIISMQLLGINMAETFSHLAAVIGAANGNGGG
ncbi:MAG TPA: Flp family type IVb pilin [Hyphomonadaceae bacterium]|jgi:pilus assembly protein Flp/PilA|nr:Flp family type IVb pilin [Hyphomonadaceae bacterium]